MSSLDFSAFGKADMQQQNSGKFGSNKEEVMKNFDEDIAHCEKNGIELKGVKNSRLYELRCWMRKDNSGNVRIAARCRGKRVFLSEEMCSEQLYIMVANEKSSIVDGMKKLRSWYDENMSDKDSLYYGDRVIKELKSY